MSSPRKTNIAASVQARLLERARRTGEDYQTLMGAFICERFLHRLDQSAARDRFILKGAMLLRLWSDAPYRATRDLDLLRRGASNPDEILADIAAICAADVEPDGLVFDPRSITIQPIRPEDEYAGTRVTLKVRCATMRMTMQVDIGVGDAVWPEPKRRAYPTLLDFPSPQPLAYAPESVIAEKFEAIVVLADRNSRIKDFFDLRYLAAHFEFDRATLSEAIRRTLERRRTPIPSVTPIGLTDAYWENPSRPAQVRAFARRAGLETGPDPGREIVETLRPFILPILEDLRHGAMIQGNWPPGGPWLARSDT